MTTEDWGQKSLVAALVHESAEHFGLRSNFHLCCVMLPRYPHRHFFQRILMENYDSTVMHLLKQFLFHTGSLWDGAEPKKVLTTRIFCVTKRWKSRTHYISLSSNKLHERLIKTIKFTDELVWRIPPVPCTKLRLGTFQSTKPLSLSKWKSWGDILLSTEMQFLKLMFKCLARTQKMSDIQFEAVLKSFLLCSQSS